MRTLAVVDTSALVAAADVSEPMHRACVEVLRRRDLDLAIPVLVVAEAAYLVERRLGPAAEAAFIRGLSGFAIEAPAPEDWSSIAEVVERYADLGLGTTDASIALLADRLDTDVVVTLDHRHFDMIRTAKGEAFRVLPPRPPRPPRPTSRATAPPGLSAR
jgi:predicted nucleic acid-binding protein